MAARDGNARLTRRRCWSLRLLPLPWRPTTTAELVVLAMAMQGLNVLVIDLDPQGNASTALGADHRAGTPSSYEVLLGEIPIKEAIQSSPQSEHLFCVPATIDLAGAEIELVSMVAREGRLRSAIAGLPVTVIAELRVEPDI